MKLTLIAVGHKMPGWVNEAFAEYQRRFPPDWPFVLKELKPETADSAAQTKAREADKILAAVPKDALLVILDERGRDLSTKALAQTLERWQLDSRHVAFVIGGTEGLDERVKAAAHFSLRLSSLTLPHMLVRVLLAEQLYRAWSVLAGHPYHRE